MEDRGRRRFERECVKELLIGGGGSGSIGHGGYESEKVTERTERQGKLPPPFNGGDHDDGKDRQGKRAKGRRGGRHGRRRPSPTH